MAPTPSAGLLVFRGSGVDVEVLVGHMGGPFWARKDEGGWSIPKGEYRPDEDPVSAARREFAEEIGQPAPPGPLIELGRNRQSNGKIVSIWAVEGDLDATAAVSNTFELQWPPGSGRIQSFPEIDRAAWFPIPAARAKVVKGQVVFLERLAAILGER